MNLRLALPMLSLFLIGGCGGRSNSISFSLNPSSATVQPNGSITISADNTGDQVEIGWTIQEAVAAGANCTQTLTTSTPPPIPPACEAFGVINIPFFFKSGQDTTVTYVAPNRAGMFHIKCDVSSITGTGTTGEQIATVTVQ